MQNDYQDESFERGVKSVVSRFIIREDYCETCKTESNLVKIQDCQNIWRCMGCLSILERKFVPLEQKTLKEYEEKDRKNDDVEPSEWEIRREKTRILAQEKAKEELKNENSL